MPNKIVKIAIVASDKISQNMGGSGIRYYQLAEALSKHFSITLFVPNHTDLKTNDFDLIAYDTKKINRSISSHLDRFTHVIAQNLRPNLLRNLKKHNIKYIFDYYDPSPIESLECGRYFSARKKIPYYDFNYSIASLQLCAADHILYASDAQRDLYIGLLLDQGLLNPTTYESDPNLEKLFSVLPFGISSTPPADHNPNFFSEKFPGINDNDHVVLWGGGIWNWFDSLSAVKAIEHLSHTHKDIKLVFMGLVHPNPQIKIMKMATDTVKYCRDKNLTNKFVFFNDSWTPYHQRHNYLLNATIGLTTHFQNLESHFSFRTRILDNFWSELPLIATEGDYFAELISKHALGLTVPYNNPKAIADAIEKLIRDQALLNKAKKNLHLFKHQFYWENLTSELVNKINNDQITSHPLNHQFYINYIKFYRSAFKCQLIDKIYE